LIITLVFWENRQFFRRKLSKIAENCDHNIDPRLTQVILLKRYHPIPWQDSISRPKAPVSSVAGRDDTITYNMPWFVIE
jgi:hypothetical protein